jgi:glycogen operon protein
MMRYSFFLACSVLLSTVVSSGCAGGDYVALYATDDHAPSIAPAEIQELDWLGPTIVDQGVNFGLWAENADRVELLVFEDPESERPDQRFPMKRFGDVWNVYVEGVGRGTHYGYIAWGPNWTYTSDWYPGGIEGFVADVDDAGNRYNPNKLLLDPYAKAVHRDHDWGRASLASGPGRTESTWGAAAKSVVWAGEYEWSEQETTWMQARKTGEAPYHARNELILYEVHPKGFTADAASGVAHPGTYRGFGEMAPYLADLGVTAVELLPIHEKPLDGGYWGYNNISFFAPELSYAFDTDPLDVIDEFKGMVDQLHQHGIEVWVDVVYNHTGEGGLWRERIYQDDVSLDPSTDASFYNFDPQEVAGLYSFRGIDNAGYYKLSEDGGAYWGNTGVGNQMRANHAPMRRLIMDSLLFMVEELHVDGFRFDLAPVLGEIDEGYDNWAPEESVLQDIVDHPVIVDNNIRMTSEPWAACWPCYQPVVGQFPGSVAGAEFGWGEWNARFRDWWRSFINDDDWTLSTREAEADGGFTLTGSYDLYADEGRTPMSSVNFVTVHDGFTMYDLVTYEDKQNGCSPLNPVCCDSPASAWCERNSGEDHNRSRDWGSYPEGEALKRQMMRNFFAAMLISHGTPLLLGGDEYMRTQLGNNNAYSTQADNPYNWFQWGSYLQSENAVRMHDFVRAMIQVRRDNLHAFAPTAYGVAPIRWLDAGGGENVGWNGKHMMVHYNAPDDPNHVEGAAELVVLLNMERGATNFTLPAGRSWVKLIDTQRWWDFDDPDNDSDFFDTTGADRWSSHNATLAAPEDVGGSYTAQDSSIVILRAGG